MEVKKCRYPCKLNHETFIWSWHSFDYTLIALSKRCQLNKKLLYRQPLAMPSETRKVIFLLKLLRWKAIFIICPGKYNMKGFIFQATCFERRLQVSWCNHFWLSFRCWLLVPCWGAIWPTRKSAHISVFVVQVCTSWASLRCQTSVPANAVLL